MGRDRGSSRAREEAWGHSARRPLQRQGRTHFSPRGLGASSENLPAQAPALAGPTAIIIEITAPVVLAHALVPTTSAMKIPLRFALSTVLFTLASLTAAPVDSRLSAVTVYADRAIVTRIATLDLAAGAVEVTFEKLPATLLDQSLQVSGRGAAEATILDVTARTTFLDFTPNERVKTLEDELRALGKQRRALDDRAKLLDAQRISVDRIEGTLVAPASKDAPRPALADLAATLAFVTEQRAKISTEIAALEEQRAALAEKITAAEKQLQQLRGTGGRNYKTVTVRLDAKSAGKLDLALSYAVSGASWNPSYDARVLGGEHAVELAYFAVVRQNTGEDWKDIALTLSTARPTRGGAAPQIAPWTLDIFNPRPMRPDPSASIMSSPFEAGKSRALSAPSAAGGMTANADAEAPERAASLAQATVETATTSASFKIATVTTVPSDNSPQKVPITSARLATAPEYSTVPKRLAAAFLTAKVTNTSDFPLLGGAMNVFLDGTFVATSSLRTVMPGEKFDLALGADEGIAVKHKRVTRFTEDTGLTNSGKRVTYEYLLTLQNNKKTAEHVIVTDQVPVSRHEKIVVKVLAPDPKDAKPAADGTLKWTLDLKPAEKRELTVKFAVDYPNEVNVAGLE